MFHKVFSQLKSTTMASVRPKLVTSVVHVPVFIPISQNKKSNIIKYQPAGSRAVCGDMLQTPFREPNHGGSQILPWEFFNWYQNIWMRRYRRFWGNATFCEEQRKPRDIALGVCFGLMPNWVHATFGQQQHLYQWALWLAGCETNAHAQNEMKWKMGGNKSDYEI